MAVYTVVSIDEAAEFIRNYHLGELESLEPIKEGVENTNYKILAGGNKYILTIFEKRTRAEDIPFFLALKKHLAAKSFKCPVPLTDNENRLYSTLKGKIAAIVTFLDGQSAGHPDATECREAGAAMAHMHLAASDFSGRRTNDLSLDGFKSLVNKISHTAVLTSIHDIAVDELGFLSSAWPQNLPNGVIHADMFPNNVFFMDKKISGVIDFYFACNDFYAYDFAILINAWGFDLSASQPAANVDNFNALFHGYNSVRRFNEQELSAINILLRAAALRFLLTRAYDLATYDNNSFVTPLDPNEYLSKLLYWQKNNLLELIK